MQTDLIPYTFSVQYLPNSCIVSRHQEWKDKLYVSHSNIWLSLENEHNY